VKSASDAAGSAAPMECDALLFDMDGVLVDSRAVVERTWRRWAIRHALDPEPILRIAHGRRTSESLRLVFPHLAVAEEVAWLDAAEMEDLEGVTAIPGASSLLSALPDPRWTIVTSAGRELAELRLRRAGLPVPPLIVSSEDVSSGKPAPDGYLTGAARLRVEPARAVVIEDAPPGLEAARAAGMRAIALSTTHRVEQLGAAAVILPDLTSLHVTIGQEGMVLRFSGEPSPCHGPHPASP
jgi:mannitol-1-/sugar-/sorbitol-6-phosphatase